MADKFDLCADKSTLDLEALIEVAANAIYDAQGRVEDCQRELRNRQLDIMVHSSSYQMLSKNLIAQESSAASLAKAAKRLAVGWRAYHHLVETRRRSERTVE